VHRRRARGDADEVFVVAVRVAVQEAGEPRRQVLEDLGVVRRDPRPDVARLNLQVGAACPRRRREGLRLRLILRLVEDYMTLEARPPHVVGQEAQGRPGHRSPLVRETPVAFLLRVERVVIRREPTEQDAFRHASPPAPDHAPEARYRHQPSEGLTS
jgi:hypothetical protein